MAAIWLSILVAIIVLVASYGLLVRRARSHFSKLRADRDGMTAAAFVDEFDGSPYPLQAIEAAYCDLAALSHLPVRRRDDLEVTLNLLPEDCELMLEQRCRAWGVKDFWSSSCRSLLPLKEAEDYVQLLSCVLAERNYQGKR